MPSRALARRAFLSVPPRQVRMPSHMRGTKGTVDEGGLRNTMAVQGPGVEAGVIDSTLVHVTDILPTMADLAGITTANTVSQFDWDGISIRNQLLPKSHVTMPSGGSVSGNASAAVSGRRGDKLATTEQKERYVFALRPNCFSADDVPLLGEDRWVT